jgi:hypothetical protein
MMPGFACMLLHSVLLAILLVLVVNYHVAFVQHLLNVLMMPGSACMLLHSVLLAILLVLVVNYHVAFVPNLIYYFQTSKLM